MMEAEGAGAFLHRLQEVEDSLVELVRISSCAPFDHLHRLVQPLLAWKITCHAETYALLPVYVIPMERAICRKQGDFCGFPDSPCLDRSS